MAQTNASDPFPLDPDQLDAAGGPERDLDLGEGGRDPDLEPLDPEAIAAGEQALLRLAARDSLASSQPRPTNLQPLPANLNLGAVQAGPRLQRRPQVRPVPVTPPRQPSRHPSQLVQRRSMEQASPGEQLVALVADHRARLVALDVAARGLEIGATVLGALGLALVIAALVSLVAGSGDTVVAGAGAVLAGGAAFGLCGLMVATAIGLRHLASVSAQVSAMLELQAQRESR
jgi:hypothetical protein